MGSLVFFAFIIGIDLLLKSMKDKKKIEAIREKKMQELKNKSNNKPVNKPSSQVEAHIERQNMKKRNNSLIRRDDAFHGEGESYRDDRSGYRDRYNDRYKAMEESYNTNIDDENHSLYDPNAIKISSKKEYKELSIRDYGGERDNVDIPVPTASTFRKDVLNGIIFSEILGKPKSLQKR